MADILPPPTYLVEMRLTLSMVVEGSMGLDKAQQELERFEKEYLDRAQHWRDNPRFGLEKPLMGEQHTQALAFTESARKVLAAMKANDVLAADLALASSRQVFLKHRAGVDTTVEAGNKRAGVAMDALANTVQTTSWALLAVLGGAVSWLVARSIVRPLNDAVALADRVAAGNLAQQVDVVGTDEASRLQRALNSMSSGLAVLVGDVRKSSSQVAVAARQLAGANVDMHTRIKRQSDEATKRRSGKGVHHTERNIRFCG